MPDHQAIFHKAANLPSNNVRKEARRAMTSSPKSSEWQWRQPALRQLHLRI